MPPCCCDQQLNKQSPTRGPSCATNPAIPKPITQLRTLLTIEGVQGGNLKPKTALGPSSAQKHTPHTATINHPPRRCSSACSSCLNSCCSIDIAACCCNSPATRWEVLPVLPLPPAAATCCCCWRCAACSCWGEGEGEGSLFPANPV